MHNFSLLHLYTPTVSTVETEILNKNTENPLVCKRYSDDVFSLWNISIEDITGLNEQANRHHPTNKFTAKIPDKETIFLDSCVYNGRRLERDLNPCPLRKLHTAFQLS